MLVNPFTILQPFADRVDVRLFRKHDAIATDDDVARETHASALASAQQVHGNVTAVIREPVTRCSGADGLITDVPRLTLSMRSADCQTFVIYERKSNVVGLLHAGWRGLIRGAIPEFFRTLESNWNILAKDAYVGAGPSLCQACAEFTDPVAELPGIPSRFFSGRHADLRGFADLQLMDAGVHRGRIERMQDCTKCKNKLYWSYRGGDREKVLAGSENVLTACLR
ncbi:MAG TPA: polyphenol oxidase family protein [Candidatus Peribacteraceae bacterium]|nr:polyphenol oxidase family protein [Candidatus Peribacteraceae bacterium]